MFFCVYFDLSCKSFRQSRTGCQQLLVTKDTGGPIQRQTSKGHRDGKESELLGISRDGWDVLKPFFPVSWISSLCTGFLQCLFLPDVNKTYRRSESALNVWIRQPGPHPFHIPEPCDSENSKCLERRGIHTYPYYTFRHSFRINDV